MLNTATGVAIVCPVFVVPMAYTKEFHVASHVFWNSCITVVHEVCLKTNTFRIPGQVVAVLSLRNPLVIINFVGIITR